MKRSPFIKLNIVFFQNLALYRTVLHLQVFFGKNCQWIFAFIFRILQITLEKAFTYDEIAGGGLLNEIQQACVSSNCFFWQAVCHHNKLPRVSRRNGRRLLTHNDVVLWWSHEKSVNILIVHCLAMSQSCPHSQETQANATNIGSDYAVNNKKERLTLSLSEHAEEK